MKTNTNNTMTPLFDEATTKIITTLGETIVEHPCLVKALDGIHSKIQDNLLYPEPSHLLIIGDSGCGKTTLCDLIANEYGSEDNEFSLGIRQNIGALMASLSSPITPRFMALTLLKALGIKGNLSGTSYDLTERLIMLFKQTNVKMVFLDEAQHLEALGISGAHGFSKKLRESLDWIKSLINRTGVTFILMGMPPLLDLIKADEQLARRFSTVHYLSSFDLPDEQGNTLGNFVESLLENACELPYFDTHESFVDPIDNAIRIYMATAGTPARIKKLVMNAARKAYELGDKNITLHHFSLAYEPNKEVHAEINQKMASHEHLDNTLSRLIAGDTINPFKLDTADLYSIAQGEAA